MSKSWREWLDIHPAAELFDLLGEDDLRALAEDIKQHGLREPVTVIKKKGVLDRFILVDGRNRLDALSLLGRNIGINNSGYFQHLSSDIDAYAYVVSANIHRRHLTSEQKRDLIGKLLKAAPEKSDRQVATTAKVDHKTVGAVRSEMEATGEIPQLKKRTGADGKGRKQPAKKKRSKLPLGWVRKPMPDCPLCEGTGQIRVNLYDCAGRKTEPMTGACACVQRKPCPTVDELKAMRVRWANDATRSKHAAEKKRQEEERREIMAADIERLASKLVENDPESARSLYKILSEEPRGSLHRLMCALARGLGINDEPDDEPGDDGLDIPACLRREPEGAASA